MEVMAMTSFTEEAKDRDALEAGATGYLLEDNDADHAVRRPGGCRRTGAPGSGRRTDAGRLDPQALEHHASPVHGEEGDVDTEQVS